MRASFTFAVALLLMVPLSACTGALIVLPDGGTDGGLPPDAGPAQVPGADDLVISELMIDPDAVDDAVGEWIEIFNPSATATYELEGCSVEDLTDMHPIGGSVRVLPGDYVTLARFTTAGEGGFTPDYVYGNAVQLVNASNTVSLICASITVDAMSYTSGQAGVAGSSLSLDPGALTASGNDVGSNWCRGTGVFHTVMMVDDLGSPGAPNPACP